MTHTMADNDTLLDSLPDDYYFDGTYEWEKDGDTWTPIHAPYGMSSLPDYTSLTKVVRRYDPLTPAPAPTVNGDLKANITRIVESAIRHRDIGPSPAGVAADEILALIGSQR